MATKIDKGKLTFDFVRAAQKVEAARLLVRVFPDYSWEAGRAVERHLARKDNFFSKMIYESRPSPAILGAFMDGKLVGTVQCNPSWRFEEDWDISWLAVDPAFRKQGIGHALIARAEDFIRNTPLEKEEREIYLDDGTKLSNARSRFYEKMGYVPAPDMDDVNGLTVLTKKIFGAVKPPEEKRPSTFSIWISNLWKTEGRKDKSAPNPA